MSRWLAITIAAVWATGCSILVEPNAEAPKCTVAPGADDPCPTGFACVEGRCRPLNAGCTPDDERCDGEDDDCDGTVDEGHDLDMDGFTWCGDGTATSTNRDCDDRSSAVMPGGAEICDGLDNDCDGEIDGDGLCEAPTVCQDGGCIDPSDCTLPENRCADDLRCDMTLTPPACVPGGCMGDDGLCGADEECDPVTNDCVPVRGLGSLCTQDEDCPAGVCVRRAAAGLSPGTQSLCTQACCSDDDCPDETLCWVSGTGTKLCIPGELVGTSRGPGAAYDSCSNGSDCASGVCLADGCVGNCADDSDCEGDGCTFGYIPRSGRELWQPVCGSEQQGAATGTMCRFDDECASFTCVFPTCGGTCSSTADCPASMYCGWAYDPNEPAYFQTCIDRYPMQQADVGDSCGGSIECIDYACILGACRGACCNDADCSGGTCRPNRIGPAQFEMHCR